MQQAINKIISWLESTERVSEEAQELLEAVKENLREDLDQLTFISSSLEKIPPDDDFEFGSALVHLGVMLRDHISTLKDLDEARGLIFKAEIPEDALPEGAVSKMARLYGSRHRD